jgi:hypothetical protein
MEEEKKNGENVIVARRARTHTERERERNLSFFKFPLFFLGQDEWFLRNCPCVCVCEKEIIQIEDETNSTRNQMEELREGLYSKMARANKQTNRRYIHRQPDTHTHTSVIITRHLSLSSFLFVMDTHTQTHSRDAYTQQGGRGNKGKCV